MVSTTQWEDWNERGLAIGQNAGKVLTHAMTKILKTFETNELIHKRSCVLPLNSQCIFLRVSPLLPLLLRLPTTYHLPLTTWPHKTRAAALSSSRTVVHSTMPSLKSAIVLLSLISGSNAFHLPARSSTLPSRVRSLQMSDTELSEVDRLRAAAAKAREEYERLSKVCW